MVQLTAEIADQVQAACAASAQQIADALSRALDVSVEITAGEIQKFRFDDEARGFDGSGLLIVMRFGDVGAVAVLPESSGLLPPWCASLDATGESKLATLGQELSVLLVPDDLLADEFQAVHVERLSEQLQQLGFADGACLVPLDVTANERQATLSFIWPATDFRQLDKASAEPEQAPAASGAGESETPAANAGRATPHNIPADDPFGVLPPYSRSLLRIRLPLVVKLARTRQSIRDIVELTPGTIVKFDKPCDEMLDLEVGGKPIARGECVKVGDKFGLRINSMILPSERFQTLQPPPS